MRHRLLPAAFLPTALLVAPSSSADTLFVDAAGGAPFADIQDALDAAADGDFILVLPGTYDAVDLLGKDVILRSTHGPAVTTIDAAGLGPAVLAAGAQSSAALLHGFTITGGVGGLDPAVSDPVGGGLLVRDRASLRVSGNLFTGNAAWAGAGLAVVEGSPAIYGNSLFDNLATSAAGGAWLRSSFGVPLAFACNDVRGNASATVGGLFLGAGDFDVRNNQFVGNTGERGAVWSTAAALGTFANNSLVGNTGYGFGAGGIEVEGDGLACTSNLIAEQQGGWGAVRGSAGASWSWNDVVDNPSGDYTGAAGDPTGLSGNVAIAPDFVLFTASDPYDDDLTLLPSSLLLDLGDPDADARDLDGSRNAIGFEGGPGDLCDGDGDGVRSFEGDCRPEEGSFFPGADEKAAGLDVDCDAWATVALWSFTAGDGGLLEDGSGVWEFAAPAPPGRAWQGTQAWCSACAGEPPRGIEATLTWALDLTAIPPDTAARLRLTHAWDFAEALDGGLLEVDAAGSFAPVAPLAGYPGSIDPGAAGNPLAGAAGAWTGDSGGWRVSDFDLSAWVGASVDVRLRMGTATAGSGAGWTLGRAAVLVEDADGDGRGAGPADCDDGDDTIYEGAAEVPYDGIDQDCDGADLEDADGDGELPVFAGGADCDDEDPDVRPGADEIPYDGVDQDCDGADLADVDGDGSDAIQVGGDDCDDGDPDLGPHALEVPYDGIDQDCDGADLTDVDGDGAPGEQGPPDGDCDDGDPDVGPHAVEVCGDAMDNNCDGAIDQRGDLDGDGVDPCDGDCDDSDPASHPGTAESCDGADNDCDGELPADESDSDSDGALPCSGDCDDGNPAIGPALADVCDGLDNDCDGTADEGHDDDGDGFSACVDDCDDRRSMVYPGAPAMCGTNLDADCSGAPDSGEEACAVTGCGAPSVAWLALLLPLGPVRRRP